MVAVDLALVVVPHGVVTTAVAAAAAMVMVEVDGPSPSRRWYSPTVKVAAGWNGWNAWNPWGNGGWNGAGGGSWSGGGNSDWQQWPAQADEQESEKAEGPPRKKAKAAETK